jgi:hypothetical protein
MVGAVEKVMNRVSEWLAKERKEKEQEEDDKKERSKWSIEREKKKAGVQERLRKLEDYLEREARVWEER